MVVIVAVVVVVETVTVVTAEVVVVVVIVVVDVYFVYTNFSTNDRGTGAYIKHPTPPMLVYWTPPLLPRSKLFLDHRGQT